MSGRTKPWIPRVSARWNEVPVGLRSQLTDQAWKHAARAARKVEKDLRLLALASPEEEAAIRRRIAHNLRLMVARYALCEALGFVHASAEDEDAIIGLHRDALAVLRPEGT